MVPANYQLAILQVAYPSKNGRRRRAEYRADASDSQVHPPLLRIEEQQDFPSGLTEQPVGQQLPSAIAPPEFVPRRFDERFVTYGARQWASALHLGRCLTNEHSEQPARVLHIALAQHDEPSRGRLIA